MLELAGKVSDDISEGQEKIGIRASNIIDDPPVAPMGFTYCKSIQIHEDVKLPAIETAGCTCIGACVDPRICACAKLNHNAFPYVDIDGKGYLIRAKSVVYECGPNCKCGPACINRTSQHGLRKVENGPEFCIDAGTMGGVARFINHSCAPNIFVQCVLSSHHDLKLARAMLFASDNIPPLQELTYDYAYVLDSVVDAK
ncbi:Histone-lysine N-methyltransferase, H3 lysine-9 specific SUVH5, partial [Thalictrum thalictroides]